jgi:hypothetical protein
MKTCETCQYFDPKHPAPELQDEENIGECRAHPPMITITGCAPNVYWGMFPAVYADEWCGEWLAGIRNSASPDSTKEPEGPK